MAYCCFFNAGDGTRLLDLAWIADAVRRHWRVLPPEEGSGKNVLQLRPTGVSLPQPGGHNGNSGLVPGVWRRHWCALKFRVHANHEWFLLGTIHGQTYNPLPIMLHTTQQTSPYIAATKVRSRFIRAVAISFCFFHIVSLTLIGSLAAYAQTNTGSIRGFVVDETQAVIQASSGPSAAAPSLLPDITG